ncbi:MAG: hypothetical protein V3W19_11420, partial [Desulfatiglandales bacterium]
EEIIMSILLILSKIAILDAIRKHERTSRPLGGDNFLSLLEEKIGEFKKNRTKAPKRASPKASPELAVAIIAGF